MGWSRAGRTAPGLAQNLPPPFGPMARLRGDALGFLLDNRRRFGDVFRMRVGPLVIHLLAHPDHLRRVLVERAADYPRSWAYGRAKVAVGEGLVTTEGDAWRRLRRISQPAFRHREVEGMDRAMTDAAGDFCRRWRDLAREGRPVDLAAEFVDLSLRIAGRTLMGLDLGGAADRVGPAITTALEYVQYRLDYIWAPPAFLPTPRNLRFRRALRALDAVIAEIIARRRAGPEVEGVDLLGLLMAARDEETGEGLSDSELRDQVMTFLAAGHETTAAALGWTISLLATHPDAWRRARDEADAVLGVREAPDASDLPRLAFTRRAVEEALRLYPPVYAVVRDARREDEVGGYRIPARSMVLLSPYVTHRHPDVWPDPEAFDPGRFLPDRSADRPALAWCPFLGGPHRCIGQEFAMMELVLVVAMLARAFRFEPAPGARFEPRPMLSLRPRYGLPMILRPR